MLRFKLKSAFVKNLESLISKFQNKVNGIVFWEMKVPATSNVAMMAAGCEGLLPISLDLDDGKFYKKVKKNTVSIDVSLDLCGVFDGEKNIELNGKIFESSGSPKNDAYKYAIEKYIRPGISNPYKMWYNCDAAMWGKFRKNYAEENYGYLGHKSELQHNGMFNGDYWVSQKAVFFDLTPWADCAPFDDMNQLVGTDNKTWHEILHISYGLRNGEFGIIGGFVPWWLKYTVSTGEKYGEVATEWEFVSLLTSYNMGNDGDAAFGIANSSFFQHLPAISKDEAKFAEPKLINYKKDVVYISFLMMDYDGSAWVNQMVPTIYNDPARGKLPLTWAINPALNFRVPHAIKYIYDNKTQNDFLGFSCDGAAYIQPDKLFNRKGRVNISGEDSYKRFAKQLNHRYGVEFNVFYIDDKIDDKWLNMASEITPRGFGTNLPLEPKLVNGTPVCSVPMFHISNTSEMKNKIMQIYKDSTENTNESNFHIFRCVLIKPSMIYDAVKKAKQKYSSANVEIIDAANYFQLLKTDLNLKTKDENK